MEKSIPNLVAVVGPTASGKSALGVTLAQSLGGEIISADSRQVYHGMDIGTGKVTISEMAGIPHHLLDVADPRDTYTVAHFVHDARDAITLIQSRNKLPIVVGGTGQYIDTLLDNISLPAVPANTALRATLAGKSTEELFEILTAKDPIRAASIDRRNPRRLERAIEISEALGSVPPLAPVESPYNVLYIGIDLPKEELNARIAKRLSERLGTGMIEEVRNLHDKAGLSWERLESLGLEYRFIARHLQGHLTRQEMESLLLQAIVNYASRQMTWFRRNKRIHWVKTAAEALDIAKKSGL